MIPHEINVCILGINFIDLTNLGLENKKYDFVYATNFFKEALLFSLAI